MPVSFFYILTNRKSHKKKIGAEGNTYMAPSSVWGF